jgi:hypothetical protein
MGGERLTSEGILHTADEALAAPDKTGKEDDMPMAIT